MTFAANITAHALQRAVERIPGCTCADDAIAILSSQAIAAAMQFAHGNQCFVRLPTGNRVVIKGNAVVTVMPIDNYRHTVRRYKRSRFG